MTKRILTPTAGHVLRRFAGFTAVALAIALASEPAGARDLVPELRLAGAYRGGSDVSMVSAAWHGAAPEWMRASRLEYSVGIISSDDTSRGFGFVGPVWHLTPPDRAWFAEFSTGPTFLSGSTVSGRELGGNFQFRSALSLGLSFGERRTMHVALRVSHISNGGLREPNPGLDFIGLSFSTGAWQGVEIGRSGTAGMSPAERGATSSFASVSAARRKPPPDRRLYNAREDRPSRKSGGTRRRGVDDDCRQRPAAPGAP